ncbi:MAG: hypothetical protein U0528_00350 [Anaerolineae bacterium]
MQHSTVQGLILNDSSTEPRLDTLLNVGGSANVIACNFIGPDSDGISISSHNSYGVVVESGSTGTIIDRNVITGSGVNVSINENASNVTLTGNYIGLGANGLPPAVSANQASIDVFIQGFDVHIGGSMPAQRNVIAGATYAIYIQIEGHDIKITGNYIGTDASGTQKAKTLRGIHIGGYSVQVGGSGAGEGNVISGNDLEAILLSSYQPPANTQAKIQGNYIGVTASGVDPLPNGVGVFVNGQDNANVRNIIGMDGIAPELDSERNIIAGSKWENIYLLVSRGQLIAGNYVGLNINGDIIGGGTGIRLIGSSHIQIGTGSAEGANIIAGHTGDGIVIEPYPNSVAYDFGNTVSLNSIYGNGGLGIRVAGGANHGITQPVLTGVSGSNTINGYIGDATTTDLVVELFVNDECDRPNYGEGQEYIAFSGVDEEI